MIRLTIEGPPRTKKTSYRIVFPGKGYSAWLERVAGWVRAGDRITQQLRSVSDGDAKERLLSQQEGWGHDKPKPPYTRLISSEYHEKWFDHAMTQMPILRRQALDQIEELPITKPVGIKALFYRAQNSGDWSGYTQALGDLLQEQKINPHTLKVTRRGLGIIGDDRQVEHWDGTRRMKDAQNPRIEIEITILGDEQESLNLQPAVEDLVAARAPSALEQFS